MTKQEWKEKLVELLGNEPEIGDKQKFRSELMGYMNMLEEKSDSYYGIRNEIIVAIEKHLDL